MEEKNSIKTNIIKIFLGLNTFIDLLYEYIIASFNFILLF